MKSEHPIVHYLIYYLRKWKEHGTTATEKAVNQKPGNANHSQSFNSLVFYSLNILISDDSLVEHHPQSMVKECEAWCWWHLADSYSWPVKVLE